MTTKKVTNVELTLAPTEQPKHSKEVIRKATKAIKAKMTGTKETKAPKPEAEPTKKPSQKAETKKSAASKILAKKETPKKEPVKKEAPITSKALVKKEAPKEPIKDTPIKVVMEAPTEAQDVVIPPKDNDWTFYYSQTICNKHFLPLLGEASRFYPKLSYCNTQVRLEASIGGKPVVFIHNSYTTSMRKDFEFLGVLMQWREMYLESILGIDKEQLQMRTKIDDDILLLHKNIKFFCSSPECTDPVVLKKYANELINKALRPYGDKASAEDSELVVRLQRLHFIDNIKFTVGDKEIHKTIDVILE